MTQLFTIDLIFYNFFIMPFPISVAHWRPARRVTRLIGHFLVTFMMSQFNFAIEGNSIIAVEGRSLQNFHCFFFRIVIALRICSPTAKNLPKMFFAPKCVAFPLFLSSLGLCSKTDVGNHSFTIMSMLCIIA